MSAFGRPKSDDHMEPCSQRSSFFLDIFTTIGAGRATRTTSACRISCRSPSMMSQDGQRSCRGTNTGAMLNMGQNSVLRLLFLVEVCRPHLQFSPTSVARLLATRHLVHQHLRREAQQGFHSRKHPTYRWIVQYAKTRKAYLLAGNAFFKYIPPKRLHCLPPTVLTR